MYTYTPEYVRTQEELDALLKKLETSNVLAIDTEFLRERTFYPKFCLLQIADDRTCGWIDVLALPSLNELLEFLNSSNRVKVLHAAHQDLEVLAYANGKALGIPIAPLSGPFVDTQVAAAYLGMPAQIGYADLVQRRLHHALAKGQARTDWSQRPLSSDQLSYAADDVIYLIQLYRDIHKELSGTPRWQWIEEDTKDLSDPRLYASDPADAWRRIRGLEQLEPENRAVAKALFEWREQRAMTSDRPRSWILPDSVVRDIAARVPGTTVELEYIKDLPKSLATKRADELLEVIASARANAKDEPPAVEARVTRADDRKISALMEQVRVEGSRLQISPERLATRRELEGMIYGGRSPAFMRGWRRVEFGERLTQAAESLFGRSFSSTSARDQVAR